MNRFVRLIALSFLLVASMASSSAFAAPSASDVVKEFYAALEGTMKQGQQLGFDGRYKKLEGPVTKAFNLPLMARYAVGPTWAKMPKEDQTKLASAFANFSVATYASRFTKYDGEVFEVLSEKPMSGKDSLMVETRLKPKEGDAVTLNYMLKPDETGALRIVDVYLDASISELATRRAEFSSVIKREGVPALIASLTDKAKKMAAPKDKNS